MYKIWLPRNYRTRVANTLLLDNALATMGAGSAVGHHGRRSQSGAPRARGLRRRRLHDELAGDGDRGAAAPEPGRSDPAGQGFRDDPVEAGGRRVSGFRLTFGDPDFVAYAEAYGAKGSRVDKADGLALALEAAFAAGGVHLVVTPIDYSENVRVLVDELRAEAGKR